MFVGESEQKKELLLTKSDEVRMIVLRSLINENLELGLTRQNVEGLYPQTPPYIG